MKSKGTCRATILMLQSLGVLSLTTQPMLAQSSPTAADITSRIMQHSGVTLPNPTVDTFKAGNPKTQVRRIAVTMMATLDVLKRAAANGDDFVITHEPTFYSHRDTLGVLEQEADPVLAEKQKFIAEHGLVIWRFHDTPHRMQPEMITKGVIHALGWESKQDGPGGQLFDLTPVKLGKLASNISAKLGAHATRIIGNPDALVSRVGMTEGFPGFAANRHVFQSGRIDVLVIGEDHEWETIEYANDAINAGQLKGIIVLGHIPSEQAGMEEVTRWLKTFITEVPIEFIPSPDPFRPLK
jgi:putative NIF3 family GTP cyclohydrolase 1 type 2